MLLSYKKEYSIDTWYSKMNLENIKLSEINQTQKATYVMSTDNKTEQTLVVVRGWRV